jgi:hypothetical protein
MILAKIAKIFLYCGNKSYPSEPIQTNRNNERMKKALRNWFLLLIATAGFSFQSATSQQLMCGEGILKSQMERNYPGYLDVVNKTFEEAKERSVRPYRGQPVYTIPTVVHIVWKEEEENLHDSIIYNQIEVLNEDFRRMNADADNIRSIFADRVGDPGIEFELVAIERVQTESEFTPRLTGLPDELKVTDEGGSDAWETEKHLNIWVCRIQPLTIGGTTLGKVLGYAYPPAGLDHWPEGVSAPEPHYDGVVIDFRIFGRNNDLTIDPGIGDPVKGYGRTATHEVGHYLGLRHIWGDAFFGDGCSVDDGVEDTPNQESSSNWACDTLVNSCPEDDLPDMIENFMDYAKENCMNSFTFGQIAIMRAVLEGPRRGLIEPTSTVQPEMATVRVNVYPNPTGSGQVQLAIGGINPLDLKLQLFDSIGRLVLKKSGLSDLQPLDLSSRSEGMYFLRLTHSESGEEVAVKKLLIQP